MPYILTFTMQQFIKVHFKLINMKIAGGILTIFCTLLIGCHGNTKDSFVLKVPDSGSYVTVTTSGNLPLSYSTGVRDVGNVKVDKVYETNDLRFYKWGEAFLTIKSTYQEECRSYKLSTNKKDGTLFVSFDIRNVYVYGGTEETNQTWPSISSATKNYPFVSLENNVQAILEPYWIFSSGHYIFVDKTSPLFVKANIIPGTFELIAENKAPYVRDTNVYLKYKICTFKDAKEAHRHAVRTELGKPVGAPNPHLVERPIWSTWVKFKVNVNQDNVYEYAKSIKDHGFDGSHLEIDDDWETCYGSFIVNKNKFPDMRKLVSDIKKLGFTVSIWVHPFININCTETFNEANQKGYLVKSQQGTVETQWWNSKDLQAAHVDFTNPDAVNWWQTRLDTLLAETDISTLKFDAGESSWSPQIPVYHRKDYDHPDTILKDYVAACAYFGNSIEVRSARGSQKYPILVRMMDRETRWGSVQGLPTLITELLHSNMIGYPFVLPDMIGGNIYQENSLTPELFIRWMQATTFMPVIQFSFLPWDLNEKVSALSLKFTKLHTKYADYINELMKKSTENGDPVNPPIWWLDPTDKVAQTIGTEYMLGEDILVAPVIEEHALSRDIYFPKGEWIDEANPDKPKIIGPTWVRDYKAELEVLPYFTRVKCSAASSAVTVTSFMVLILVSICISVGYF